jgi:hypothetical protein
MHETGQELGDLEQAGRCPEAGGLGEGAGKKKRKTPCCCGGKGQFQDLQVLIT